MRAVVCPQCGIRKARRGCPALGTQICPICCGTKRLVEIPCPSDCPWLASSREHPAAVVVRQQQQDVGLLVRFIRDLSERQSQLFFLIATFIVRYVPPALQPLVDDDVIEAADAMAATYETAARGVIYEQRPSSVSAERFAVSLKAAIAEATKGGGSALERDSAAVLRRVIDAARDARTHSTDPRVFIALLGRVLRSDRPAEAPPAEEPASRLILP